MSEIKGSIDDWQLIGTLGKGTFGRVTLWTHKITGEAIAVKECCVTLNPKSKRRWREEIEMLTQIKHSNLVGMRDVPLALSTLINSPEPCLGMEHCEGGDLRKILNQPINCTGLNEFDVLNILNDVLSAVKFLHLHKIIHRDLKPENILVSFIGDKVIYKVTDLGYAKHLDHTSVANSFVGTMKYVAPELFSSEEEGYTVTADFWSLGNVIFECITGHRPFDFKNSFVDWHRVVSSKRSEDICGSEVAGEVIFQATIPPPYKLSSPLIPMFESWFRSVMEYDPRIRGGERDQAGERLCYRIADNILSTKVVHVFCVNSCKLFSFVFNETDTVRVLQREISEYCPEFQEFTFLLADGAVLHPDTSLSDCYNQRGDSEWLIYVINAKQLIQLLTKRKGPLAGQLVLSNIYQELNESIREMVKNQEVRRNHVEYIRLWHNTLHFINEMAKTFRRLVQGHRAVMITLIRCNSELMQKKEEMTAEAYRLAANVELFLESCNNDLQYFHQTNFSKTPANKGYAEQLHSMIEQAKTYHENLTEEVSNRVTAAQKELVNLKNNPLVGNPESELDRISKSAISEYEATLKIEKTNPDPRDSQCMARLVLQVLTVWERLESNFVRQLGKVLTCKIDMENLISEMTNVIVTLTEKRESIHKEMKRKQELTWKTLTVGSASPLPLFSPDSFVTTALTSILEEIPENSGDPQSLIDENEVGLERLRVILEGFKDVTEVEEIPELPRRQSADAVMQSFSERQRMAFAKRRTVSDVTK